MEFVYGFILGGLIVLAVLHRPLQQSQKRYEKMADELEGLLEELESETGDK